MRNDVAPTSQLVFPTTTRIGRSVGLYRGGVRDTALARKETVAVVEQTPGSPSGANLLANWSPMKPLPILRESRGGAGREDAAEAGADHRPPTPTRVARAPMRLVSPI